jgi:hypothetical protein
MGYPSTRLTELLFFELGPPGLFVAETLARSMNILHMKLQGVEDKPNLSELVRIRNIAQS